MAIRDTVFAFTLVYMFEILLCSLPAGAGVRIGVEGGDRLVGCSVIHSEEPGTVT